MGGGPVDFSTDCSPRTISDPYLTTVFLTVVGFYFGGEVAEKLKR